MPKIAASNPYDIETGLSGSSPSFASYGVTSRRRSLSHRAVRRFAYFAKSMVFVTMFLAASFPLRAEIMVGASLEWLADTSASVGIYRVTKAGTETNSTFHLSFQLDNVLKGKPPHSTASSYRVRFPEGSPSPSVAAGERFLIFLKLDGKDAARVAHLINLSMSQDGGMESVAINCKFEVLTDQAQILATVQGRIKSHPTATPAKWREYPNSRFDVQVPSWSPAYKVLYGGSACYLLVPEDLKPAKPNK